MQSIMDVENPYYVTVTRPDHLPPVVEIDSTRVTPAPVEAPDNIPKSAATELSTGSPTPVTAELEATHTTSHAARLLAAAKAAGRAVKIGLEKTWKYRTGIAYTVGAVTLVGAGLATKQSYVDLELVGSIHHAFNGALGVESPDQTAKNSANKNLIIGAGTSVLFLSTLLGLLIKNESKKDRIRTKRRNELAQLGFGYEA